MLVDDFKAFAKDTGIASGGLSLYLSTSRADHLRGGLVSVNCKIAFSLSYGYVTPH